MSFQKTYSITLKFSAKSDNEVHAVEMRELIKKQILGSVGSMSQGALEIHIVGDVEET
jgi:hypothetical protein